MARRLLIHEEFVEKLKNTQPELKVVGQFTGIAKKVLVEDAFGIMGAIAFNLLEGHVPDIRSAEDKTAYLMAWMSEFYPNLPIEIVGEYIGGDKPILVETPYGICTTTPANLKKGKMPKAHSAINTDDYVKRQCREVHGEYYGYDKLSYKKKVLPITITCPLHGDFEQTLEVHLGGGGCQVCAEITRQMGYYGEIVSIEDTKNIKSGVYVLKISGSEEVFWKVGISKNLKDRLTRIGYETKLTCVIEALCYVEMSLFDAVAFEQTLFKKYKHLQYKPKVKFNGYTECFSVNPLENFEEFK